jgi:hypothetical protein
MLPWLKLDVFFLTYNAWMYRIAGSKLKRDCQLLLRAFVIYEDYILVAADLLQRNYYMLFPKTVTIWKNWGCGDAPI